MNQLSPGSWDSLAAKQAGKFSFPGWHFVIKVWEGRKEGTSQARVAYFGSILSSSRGQGASQSHPSPGSKQRKQLVLGSEPCQIWSVEICGLRAMGTLGESRVGLRNGRLAGRGLTLLDKPCQRSSSS